MASGGRKTTIAKLNRERRLREKRVEKQARKEARKEAALHPPTESDDYSVDPSDDSPQVEKPFD